MRARSDSLYLHSCPCTICTHHTQKKMPKTPRIRGVRLARAHSPCPSGRGALSASSIHGTTAPSSETTRTKLVCAFSPHAAQRRCRSRQQRRFGTGTSLACVRARSVPRGALPCACAAPTRRCEPLRPCAACAQALSGKFDLADLLHDHEWRSPHTTGRCFPPPPRCATPAASRRSRSIRRPPQLGWTRMSA